MAGGGTAGGGTAGGGTAVRHLIEGDAGENEPRTGNGGRTEGAPPPRHRSVVPAQRRSMRRSVVARQPGRVSRALGRVALRVAEAASRFGARRSGTTRPPAVRTGISEAELRELVAANVAIDVGQRQIIAEVLSAGARHVREVMVPRIDAIFVDSADPAAAALERVVTTRHSRFPVIDGTHDDVVGVVQVWDLLLAESPGDVTVGDLARPVHHIPGSKHVLAALSDMRREGHHLAVVVDEYGLTAGIVTLEDLVEELVGEVHADGGEPDTAVAAGKNPQALDGRTNLNDFAERCGFALPPGPYETVGGFVMARLGRLPRPGDEVAVGAWRLRVTECDGRRVSRVTVLAAASA
jgi:putative hemolysin